MYNISTGLDFQSYINLDFVLVETTLAAVKAVKVSKTLEAADLVNLTSTTGKHGPQPDTMSLAKMNTTW